MTAPLPRACDGEHRCFLVRGRDRFAWLGSATDGQMTIPQAVEARKRIMAGDREEAVP